MTGLIIAILYISLISAGTSYFLNFAFGDPLGNINEKAIFFKYAYFLAVLRLKKYDPLVLEQKDKAYIVSVGRQFFTWEYAAGMCAICSNVWLTGILYTAAVFLFPTLKMGLLTIVNGWAAVLISHIVIRKNLLN